MLRFCFMVFVALSSDFYVSACKFTIGENKIKPIYCSSEWHTDPPELHPGYEIRNVEKTAVQARIYWKDSWPLQNYDIFCEAPVKCKSNSTANFWHELPSTVHIEPSEKVIIMPPENVFYFTRLVVMSNDSNGIGIVNTRRLDGEESSVEYKKRKKDVESIYSNLSLCYNLKTALKFAGSKIPPVIAGSGIEALIELYWSKNKMSVWHEILHHIRYLIGGEMFIINNLLGRRLAGFKDELEQVAREVKEGQSNVSFHYMNLAQDLIGLEEESIIRGHYNAEKMNEALLPVYSNIILMKAAFYSLGIKCQERIGLSQQNVASIKTYFTNLIRSPSYGANHHISQIFRNQNAENFQYNKEMYTRNKIKEHGYISIWNNMLDQPGQKLVIDEIFYSNFQGYYYANKNVIPSLGSDPLSSAGLFKGEYNELWILTIYQNNNACVNCCPEAIVGMKLTLKNGNTFEFGNITHVSKTIELNGTYRIRDIEARSNNTEDSRFANFRISLLKLDKNEWKNSIEDEYTFGCPTSNSSKLFSFAKQNYYIASIFASFDESSKDRSLYPMLHMGVAFLPMKSLMDNSVDEKNWKEWTC